MTAYRYRAARADGHVVRGAIESASGADAAATLTRRGLFPIGIEASTERDSAFARRPSPQVLATVVENLASLLDVGVPLQKALQAAERAAAGPVRDALERIETRVREGVSLGGAVAAERRVFGPVAAGLIRTGERGVGLVPALQQAAAQLQREADTRDRLRAALAYPLVLAVVGGLSIAVLLLVVVPRFAGLLGESGAALPAATRVLIGLSALLRGHGGIVAGAAFLALGAGAAALVRHPLWQSWALDVPLAGRLAHGLATARVCRTLGALLGTGAPILDALGVATETAGHAAVRARLVRARERVAEGWCLSAALEADAALTAGAVHLVRIGEGSGRLPELLTRASDVEERLAAQRIRTLVGVLEPALILGFAALVAFVAAGLLQGLYSLRPGVS